MTTVERYIRSIRNRNKRAYAVAYERWLRDGRKGFEPLGACGAMARQAVRMRLLELVGPA